MKFNLFIYVAVVYDETFKTIRSIEDECELDETLRKNGNCDAKSRRATDGMIKQNKQRKNEIWWRQRPYDKSHHDYSLFADAIEQPAGLENILREIACAHKARSSNAMGNAQTHISTWNEKLIAKLRSRNVRIRRMTTSFSKILIMNRMILHHRNLLSCVVQRCGKLQQVENTGTCALTHLR